VNEVPSGAKCFDWTIPQEWNCNDGYIIDPDGNKICDFKTNNLHIVGYSTPIDSEIELEELIEHLYYLEEQPTAIPYITSYYSPRWGFCLSFNEFQKLKKGTYKVKINSELKDGNLTYGEIKLKGVDIYKTYRNAFENATKWNAYGKVNEKWNYIYRNTDVRNSIKKHIPFGNKILKSMDKLYANYPEGVQQKYLA